MTRVSEASRALIIIGLTVLGSGAAAAQTIPPPDRQPGVREILGQAQVESARRTIGNILGGITGTAQAQTVPPPSPRPPGQAGLAGGQPASQPASRSATLSPSGTAVVSPPGTSIEATPITPSAPFRARRTAAAPQGLAPAGGGTANDPTMINRVPDSIGGPLATIVAGPEQFAGAAVIRPSGPKGPSNIAVRMPPARFVIPRSVPVRALCAPMR